MLQVSQVASSAQKVQGTKRTERTKTVLTVVLISNILIFLLNISLLKPQTEHMPVLNNYVSLKHDVGST